MADVLPPIACRLRPNQTVTLDFLQQYLDAGCDCNPLEDLPLEVNKHIHCDVFPVDHDFYIQVFYCLLFSLLVLFSVAGNLTVTW